MKFLYLFLYFVFGTLLILFIWATYSQWLTEKYTKVRSAVIDDWLRSLYLSGTIKEIHWHKPDGAQNHVLHIVGSDDELILQNKNQIMEVIFLDTCEVYEYLTGIDDARWHKKEKIYQVLKGLTGNEIRNAALRICRHRNLCLVRKSRFPFSDDLTEWSLVNEAVWEKENEKTSLGRSSRLAFWEKELEFNNDGICLNVHDVPSYLKM